MRPIFFLICCSFISFSYAQQDLGLIPVPEKFVRGEGSFKVNTQTCITYNNDQLKPIAYYFQNELLKQKGLTIQRKKSATNIILHLITNKEKQSEDAYAIKITPERIVISATGSSGIFYGVISLLQITLNSKSNEIPSCNITDSPAYSWRGLMFDESRHFFGKQKVKSILNWMAFYKLNILHWHLTDEPAWRLEVKKYPNLTLVGGIGNYLNPYASAQYYTQEDIKEIVAYAAERFIKIVPEIDMPGHATAANKAYPKFSGGGSDGHPEFTFNPGLESTYSYLTNILRETNIVFPSGLIHLGGDEVSYGNQKWRTDTSVVSLKQREHLNSDKDVERYFIKRMADSVYKMNANVLVWDENADAGLPIDKTIIFWWRQDRPEELQTSLKNHYKTVLCPRLPLYFDFVQDSSHLYGRKWNKLYNSLEQVYNFDARSFVSHPDQKALIIGIQANIWTETADSEQRLEYLLFPRIAALAESSWTKAENKNLTGFNERIKEHLKLYSQAGIYYYDPFNTLIHPEPVPGKKYHN